MLLCVVLFVVCLSFGAALCCFWFASLCLIDMLCVLFVLFSLCWSVIVVFLVAMLRAAMCCVVCWCCLLLDAALHGYWFVWLFCTA